MPNLARCRARAEECRCRAAEVSDGRDRAKWLELADEWEALTRIPFQTLSKTYKYHAPNAGLWRGERGIKGASQPKVSKVFANGDK